MARAAVSEYFPPLDRCLDGDELLVSWKTAFIGLSSPASALSRDSALERFLSDPQTTSLLSRPFTAFSPPTAQTKSIFETKTAAINLTATNHDNHDVEQLKQDALWLSKEANIDEVTALRIAVIELQSRSEALLLSNFAEEESASVQDIAGLLTYALSISLPASSAFDMFNSQLGRQLRLVKLYLSERRHLLKITEILVRTGLSKESLARGRSKGKARATWVEGIGKTILNARCSGSDAIAGFEPFLAESIEALQKRVNGLTSGSGMFADEALDTDIEIDWGKCVLLEMIHILQLMFSIIDSLEDILSSSIVLAWLRFAGEYAFFDNLELSLHSHQVFVPHLKALVSIVSLAILKLPHVIEHIRNQDDRSALPSPTSPNASIPFLLDASGITEIHAILLAAAENFLVVASPMVFAWGIILQSLREVVISKKEIRELQQSQNAVEGFADTDTSTAEDGDSSPTGNRARRPPLRRATSSDKDVQPNIYDDILKSILDMVPDDDAIQFLAKSAVNGSNVFEAIQDLAFRARTMSTSEGHGEVELRMRVILLELLRSSLDWVQYSPEIVTASLAVLTGGENFWILAQRTDLSQVVDAPTIFLEDEQMLMPKLLGIACARFPLEALPLLSLLKALGTCPKVNKDEKLYISAMLEHMTSFAHALPEGYRDYDTIREEENTNQVVLRADMPLFIERGARSLLASREGDDVGIQAGTEGRVLSESNPVVVLWMYQFSGLRYLGRVLESALPSNNVLDNVPHLDSQKGIVAETIGLFAILLISLDKLSRSSDNFDGADNAAHNLLAQASGGLAARSGDIVTVIFDLFETESQEPQLSAADEESMGVLVSCAQFVFALTSILPGRVWPFLARSGLLEIDGRGGRLAEIVASTEIVSGRYEFLIGCIQVFEALVDEAVAHVVARKSTSSAIARFKEYDSLGTGVSVQVMSKVVLAFVRALVDVFESFLSWKYLVLDEKLQIGTMILTLFDSILHYTHGVDDATNPDEKITSMLGPAANYLVEVFLSTSANRDPIKPLLGIFTDGVRTPHSTLFMSTSELWKRQTKSALSFCTTLLRVNNFIGRSSSHLEILLFKASPLLVRIYGAFECYKCPVVTLLEAMIISAASAEGEPLSLPGHLGSETAKNFLILLSHFSKPLDDESLDVGIWNFMSAIVSSRQQWFAIYLLTGNAPRDTLKRSGNETTNARPASKNIFSQALDSLAKVNQIPPKSALAILEFVALAADYWPWSISEIHKRQDVLTSLAENLNGVQTRINFADHREGKTTCDALRMASLILEILAIYLHHCQQLGDISFAKKLLPQISYYTDNAVSVKGYNSSLHANLKRNFEARFSGCRLSSLRRTKLQRADLGSDFYYDMAFARKVLEYDSSWLGAKGPGLAEEFERANNNLSLVEAQVLLLCSWRTLVLQLSYAMSKEISLQELMVNVVKKCLLSNSNKDLPDAIFNRLSQMRSDLAFILMQKLAEVASTVSGIKMLLFTTWDTIRSSDTNIELAIAGGEADYYRPLLKILFLSLRAHMGAPAPFAPMNSGVNTSGSSQSQGDQQTRLPSTELQLTVLDIIDMIVTRGFRNLAVRVHESPSSSSPEDIALVTAILQTALHIPGIESSHTQICTKIIDEGAAHIAINLFSWSDRLAINGDPVYGELAILFLLELSSMPLMAEQLAVDGIISLITDARLTSYIRQGIHPIKGNQRLYSIWFRGILPLCLNLLHAIGPPIAPEISKFLNQFSNQLTRAADNFDNAAGAAQGITLPMAVEAHSLALIYRILEGFRAAGASTGVLASEIASLEWHAAGVKEDVEYWLGNRESLRHRLMPVTARDEEEMTREKPLKQKDVLGSSSENRFEERVVRELSAVVGLLSE